VPLDVSQLFHHRRRKRPLASSKALLIRSRPGLKLSHGHGPLTESTGSLNTPRTCPKMFHCDRNSKKSEEWSPEAPSRARLMARRSRPSSAAIILTERMEELYSSPKCTVEELAMSSGGRSKALWGGARLSSFRRRGEGLLINTRETAGLSKRRENNTAPLLLLSQPGRSSGARRSGSLTLRSGPPVPCILRVVNLVRA